MPFHLPRWIQRGFSSCNKKALLLKKNSVINQNEAYRIEQFPMYYKWFTPKFSLVSWSPKILTKTKDKQVRKASYHPFKCRPFAN